MKPRVIFLSAVSSEFHRCPPDNPRAFDSYRFVLRAAFEKLAPHYEVIIQEDLTQGTMDLLKTLDDEVARSTLVVHLVGDLAGWKPQPAELRRLQERHRDALLASEPELKTALGDPAAISYTQWEAYLAYHHARPRLVFTATPTSRRSPLFVPDQNERSAQQLHLDRLSITGAHRSDFTDQRHVAYKALRAFLNERLDPAVDPVEPSADATGQAWAHQREIVEQLAAALRKPDPRLILENDPARVVTFVAALRQGAEHWQVNLATILNIAARHEAAMEAAATAEPSTESLHDLAFAAYALADYRKAQSIAQSAAEFALQLAADQPADATEHQKAAINAFLLQHQAAQALHDTDAAIRALQQAGALVDKDADPLLWAEVHQPLAKFLLDHAHYDEADDLISDLVDIREEHLGEQHPELAETLLLWGSLLDAQGKYEGVISVTARAERIFAEQVPPRLTGVAAAMNNRAQALKAMNRLAEAEPLIRLALAMDEASFGPNHPEVAISLNNLALMLRATNRRGEAEEMMRRALKITEASLGPDHPSIATRLNNLSMLLQETNRLAEAEEPIRRALKIDEASFGPNHPDVARDLNNLASLLQDTNRLAEAEEPIRRALKIDEASFGPNHPRVAMALNNLSALLKTTNRFAEAEPLIRRVVVIFANFTAQTRHEHPHLRIALGNYHGLLLQSGHTEAEAMEKLRSAAAEGGVGLG